MKLKRTEFKELIKECLMEILSESFIDNLVKQRINEMRAIQQSASQPQYIPPRPVPVKAATATQQQLRETLLINNAEQVDWAERQSRFKDIINNIKNPQKQSALPQSKPVERIVESNDTPAGVMQSIFEDTARTTVKAQAAAESGNIVDANNEEGIDVLPMMTKDWGAIAGL
jgi:hypothetical protein